MRACRSRQLCLRTWSAVTCTLRGHGVVELQAGSRYAAPGLPVSQPSQDEARNRNHSRRRVAALRDSLRLRDVP